MFAVVVQVDFAHKGHVKVEQAAWETVYHCPSDTEGNGVGGCQVWS